MSRPDRWQRAAERANERAERAAGPLFVAFAAKTTPEAVQARTESLVARQAGAMAESERRMAEHAAEARETVSWVVSPEALVMLDYRRSASPPTSAFSADFWCGEARRRCLPWPGRDAYADLWAEVDRLAALRPAPALPPEQVALPLAFG